MIAQKPTATYPVESGCEYVSLHEIAEQVRTMGAEGHEFLALAIEQHAAARTRMLNVMEHVHDRLDQPTPATCKTVQHILRATLAKADGDAPEPTVLCDDAGARRT